MQGALKLILEPIFEADFKEGSYGYRPKKTAHQAIEKVAKGIIQCKTKVIDVDLKSYFDNIRHHILMSKVAKRIKDNKIMRLLKLILKANGKKGLSQGGAISPLLANLYLNDVDEMLEKGKEYTSKIDGYTHIEYTRFADDMVILVDNYQKWAWLVEYIQKRLKQEFVKIGVEINEEKTKVIDLEKGGSFSFLGFKFKRIKTKTGKKGVNKIPRMKARTNLLRKLKEIFKNFRHDLLIALST